jgi:LmbE family N-acetylglucosaminyl deacetylase
VTTNKQFSYEEIFANKRTALFVVAHPDDIDAYFAGLIVKLVADGVGCHFLVLTSGDLGSEAAQRESEQIDSLKIAGVAERNVEFLRLKDGFLENDHEMVAKISKAIRKWQPDIVATIDPRDLVLTNGLDHVNHRDHRNAGLATLDAVYPFSSLDTFFPEYGKAFKVTNVLLADPNEANFIFDFSKSGKIKKKMLLAHKSQWDEKYVKEILEGNNYKEGTLIERFYYLKLGW